MYFCVSSVENKYEKCSDNKHCFKALDNDGNFIYFSLYILLTSEFLLTLHWFQRSAVLNTFRIRERTTVAIFCTNQVLCFNIIKGIVPSKNVQ